jgi:hypothetical protein
MKARLLAAVAAAVLALFFGAAPAMASGAPPGPLPGVAGISPTTVWTSNGEGGYYSFVANRTTAIRAHFFLRTAAEGIGATGGLGVQLCQQGTAPGTGDAAQLGTLWNAGAGVFEVFYQTGTLAAHSPNTNGDACSTGGLLASPLDTGLDIAPGQEVKLSIQDNSGVCEFRSSNVTVSTGVVIDFKACPGLFNDAGVGAVQDLTLIAPPASVELARFTQVTQDTTFATGTLSGAGTAVQVNSSANGSPSDPAIVSPNSSLSGSVFKLYAGSPVGAKQQG